MSLFLGIDLSTQQLKSTVIDKSLNVVSEFSVPFDEHFGEKYKIKGGVQQHSDGLTVTVPSLMWVEALDVLFSEMKKNNFDFQQVQSISGTGQQHGSVYWRTGAENVLQHLDPSHTLVDQLSANSSVFSIKDSPIWMDSSTTKECKMLEAAVGGPQKIAALTGSRAYERFTGNQIAKLQKTSPSDIENTERIALVSSFVATLLIGKHAPIDISDGSGMNLLNLQTKQWEESLLKATGVSDLGKKLGAPVPSDTVVGEISNYFVSRYGFSQNCTVGAFTGDNPASLAGMRIGAGDMTVSLGTSDTLFLWLNDTSSLQKERKYLDGHVFCNPVDENAYMALLCYKNGSLVREHIRDLCLNKLFSDYSKMSTKEKWDKFNSVLASTAPGNSGAVAVFFEQMEITPSVRGTIKVDAANNHVQDLSPEQEIRALIEGQFMAKRLHAERLGYDPSHARRILATGGASNNSVILQILSDVFGAPVFKLEQANSASLGCAYRALHSWLKHVQKSQESFEQVTSKAPAPVQVASPNLEATKIYTQLLPKYAALEEELLNAAKQ